MQNSLLTDRVEATAGLPPCWIRQRGGRRINAGHVAPTDTNLYQQQHQQRRQRCHQSAHVYVRYSPRSLSLRGRHCLRPSVRASASVRVSD